MEVIVIASLGINHPSHDQNKVGVAKKNTLVIYKLC